MDIDKGFHIDQPNIFVPWDIDEKTLTDIFAWDLPTTKITPATSRASLMESMVLGQPPFDNMFFAFTLLSIWIALSKQEVLSAG